MVLDEHGELAVNSAVPGAGSINDEMDGLMSDWSWRPRLRDLNPPVYVYDQYQRETYEVLADQGCPMRMCQPWSFPAYRGPVARPPRIGVTR